MKVLQFYLKYFLFRSTRRVENIERVIRSHGFKIYDYRPEETTTKVADLIRALGAEEFAQSQHGFVVVNPIIKGVFIKKGMSDADRICILFHEEAHIWFNHLNTENFTNQTHVQKEAAAHNLLLIVRILKAVTAFVVVAALVIALRFWGVVA